MPKTAANTTPESSAQGAQETPAGLRNPGRAVASTATPPDTLSYLVISPLHHDGQPYQIGDTVDLTGAAAAPLIGLRVVEPVAADQPNHEAAT